MRERGSSSIETGGDQVTRGWARRWLFLGATALVAGLLTAASASTAAEAAQTKPLARHPAPATPKGKPPPAHAAPPAGLAIDTVARNALIIEMDTGTVLYQKLPDQRIPPASTSKLMTAYVVFGLLKAGRAKLTDELPVSSEAWKLGGSKMFVPVGGRISIDSLLQGMIVQSGNDSCVVLAEGLAGSQAAFVDLMNKKAAEIGLRNSHFANVDGLPDPGDWMTARDLATLAERTIIDFPQYYHYYSEKGFNFSNIEQGNRNPLLYNTPGADGLKTGHTEESGFSIVGSVARGKRRVILVLMGMPTMKARAQESERLAEWAFREFDDYRLFSAGDVVDEAEVWLGSAPKVAMTAGRDVVVTMPRSARRDMKVAVNYNRPIPAPIDKGEAIGKLEVTAPGMSNVELPLYAAADVPRIGRLGRIATMAGYLIWGNRH
jgi:serine-type D-Ala-D-Ala carboxypeptidase (penicillin-binding protein 5/6)